jgi:hypothetical protein
MAAELVVDVPQARTQADEIMISTRLHSYEARLRSLTMVAEGWGLTAPAAGSALP